MVSPNADLESYARQSAQEWVETILHTVSSVEEVTSLGEQILSIMWDEWSRVDWRRCADEVGVQPLPLGFKAGQRQAHQSQVTLAREFLESLLLSGSEEDGQDIQAM